MEHYEVSKSEKAKLLEEELAKEISELKNEIEECEMSFGNFVRPMSSFSCPMSSKYFQKQREHAINEMLCVEKILPLKNQGQVMVAEVEATLNSDFSEKGIPMLLHQHYLDQIKQQVNCKHLHMLRWTRFCEHADTIERLYSAYKTRLGDINSEYCDAKNRAKRLSVAYHSTILGENADFKCVHPDDMLIFLRWLVTNLHLTKTFCAFLKIMQWLPIIHKNNIDIQQHANTKFSNEVQIETGKVSFDAKSAWHHLGSSIQSRSSGRQSSFAIATELAFSGFVSNETTLGIPVHMIELQQFNEQLESLAHEYGVTVRSEIITSADEMELFGAVNRRFKSLHNRQVECQTFYYYDSVPEGQEHWGIDSASHCLIKPQNWCKFIKIKPQADPLQLRQMTTLRQKQNIDELLASQNRFLNVGDHTIVTESLKEHAVAVRDPPTVQVLQVTSHKHGKLKSSSVWQRIYDNANENFSAADKHEEKTSKFGGANKKRDSYDYANTMQMLGLDEGEESSSQDPTIIQGAYLSFLHLRHLKIKDMKRQCLGMLNYFRSIERSITIYDGGLSLESKMQEGQDDQHNKTSSSEFKDQKSKTKQDNRKSSERKEGGISSHHYMFNTPADFIVEQNKFMEFKGVENHDDFYVCDLDDNMQMPDSSTGAGDGSEWQSCITAAVSSDTMGLNFIPHVQDQRGYYIMYDAAVQDLNELEEELLLVASHYIEKDTANRSVPRRSTMETAQRKHEAPGEVDVASYGHRNVDRFAILFDMWTCEVNFLGNKLKLLNCFYEAYQNTFCSESRRQLAQVIANLLHQRPRYDFTQDYFVQTYKSECACLRLKTSIITQILNSHIDDCRQYLAKVVRQPHVLGMPFHSAGKQEVATNTLKPALKYLDMFEFHPNLGAVAGRFNEAVKLAFENLVEAHDPQRMCERISLEKQVLELAHREWEGMSQLGSSYTVQTQRNLFFDQYVEDPNLLIETIQSLVETGNDVESKSEDQSKLLQVLTKCIEMVVLRYRLIDCAWETEILSRLYKQIAKDMGYDEHHMYLRLVQFEFANFKDKVDLPPSMQSSFIPDEMNVDRYVPAQLQLSVQEMDENHLPKLSFHNRDGIVQILNDNGIKNLQVTLACQVVHKNALITAITMASNCSYWKEIKVSSEQGKDTNRETSETRSSHSVSTTLTQGTVRSGTASPSGVRRGVAYTGKLKFGFDKHRRTPEAFISIQLEKCGPRDVVVNAFVRKKETSGMILKKPGEIEKLKQALITDFCKEVAFRMSLHAMRGQIIACYASILHTLKLFQPVQANFFMIGVPNEKKHKQDDAEGMIPDPKTLHKRPRRVYSSDGKYFLNLWFIPHFSEILSVHRNLDYESQHKLLTNWLAIASSLHDIILHLCAHAHLGSTAMDKEILDKYTAAPDWGGCEGIGTELRIIQEQIDAQPQGAHPFAKDPAKVAELLTLRKEAAFLQFDAAVRHMIRETFLATENVAAYMSITNNMQYAFSKLNYQKQSSLTALHINVPQPYIANRKECAKMFPWISFSHSNGPFPTSYPQYWRSVESSLQLCLAGLNYTDRKIANGDILGVNLHLQEILKDGTAPLLCLQGTADEMPKGYLMLTHVGKHKTSDNGNKNKNAAESSQEILSNSKGPAVTMTLNKQESPNEGYRLENTYLKLWRQLELLKSDWGTSKLQVYAIDTPFLFREFSHVFRGEIILPVFTSMARQMGNLDEYDDIAKDDEPVKLPPHAPELAVKARLLIKLLEILECKMIAEVRQTISREYTQVLAERSREENALPTDLWRHSMGENGVKENFTVSRPLLVENFVQKLYAECETENGSITFNKKHLESCISSLGTSVMQRERENYESYSLYYESLLKHYHHLLYLKELEAKSADHKSLEELDQNSSQFQLADQSHELILEITALRAKVSEMRLQSITMDQDLRDDVRRDYQELVQNLFEVCFQMKARLAQCHLTIHDDIRSLIGETRLEAMRSLGKLKSESPTSTAEERLRTIAAKDKKIAMMQQEYYELNMLLSKLTALNHWKQTTTNSRYKVMMERSENEVNKIRRDCTGKEMVADEKTSLFKEELVSLRQSLNESEKRLKKAHQEIDREKKIRKEKEYEEVQEQRNRQQLEQARQRNMKRLVIELEEKNARLRSMTVDLERNAQVEQSHQTKIQRSLKQMHAQLSMERSLKLDAFDRVDSLQAQVMETEREATPSVAASAVSPAQSRLTMTRNRPSSSYNSARTPNVKVRPMSSFSSQYKGQMEVMVPRKRPQTAAGRLKSTIAAALLTEIYPSSDVHETIVQLDRQNH